MLWMNDIALREEMGIPFPDSPKPRHTFQSIFVLNKSKSPSDWEKDLDDLLLLRKGKDSLRTPTSNRVDSNSGKEDPIPHDSFLNLVIKSTPEGRMVRWEEKGLHHHSAEVFNLCTNELPF